MTSPGTTPPPGRPTRTATNEPPLDSRPAWGVYVGTGEGWLYVATVIDLFSRRVIGWAAADHLRAELACDALSMAIGARGGDVSGVVFHSDRGCQYTSNDYRTLCNNSTIRQSMGATGNCFDNAVAESFFGSLKRELVYRHRWATRADARRAITRWISSWYNAARLHSSLGYRTPIEKEADWHAAQRHSA